MESSTRLMGQRRSLKLGFLLMGFSFAVTQSLLIRAFLVAFYGNELSIGLILGTWLLLEAIGSGVLARYAGRRNEQPPSFAALQVLFALFLPLCLFAINLSRHLAGAIPGEGIGPIPVFWSSFLILAPLGLVDGVMFALGSRVYVRLVRDEAASIGRVYVLEALGGITGGIVFTYLFIPFLHALQIVLLLSALNLIAAILILAAYNLSSGRRCFLRLGIVAVLLLANLVILLTPLAQRLQNWRTAQRWPGYDVLYSENSAYGNVSVVERAGQFTFLADGIPVLSGPFTDVALSEELVHLPMLFVSAPQRALVLSGGLGGVLAELAKYPLEQIDYAELDPLLIDAVRQFPTPVTASELGEPRLRLELVDGRVLLRNRHESPGEYDLIIVNLPYPSTLQLNRFYTVEFFQMVRKQLSEEGVFVIAMPGSLSYLGEELRDLNAVTFSTLREVFPIVRPIPGERVLWLALSDGLNATVDSLAERWQARGIEAELVNEQHIRLRLAPRYRDWFWTALDAEEVAPKPNRDLHPLGLFHGLSYWNALFSPDLAPVYALAGKIGLLPIMAFLAGCTVLFFAFVMRTGRGRGASIPFAIAATGFVGMTADLVFILTFQSLYGHVYQWIGLLFTAFMAGLAAGGMLMNRLPAHMRRDRRTFLSLEVAQVIFWVLVPLILSGLYGRAAQPALFRPAQVGLFALNGLAGFLVGAQFPLANRLWLRGRERLRGGEGALYASDLVGAFLGSILVSVLLVPVLGIVSTCLLAATLKSCSLLLYSALSPRA